MDALRKKESLCRLLIAAALLRGELATAEDDEELDSDLQVVISCAVSAAHSLEIQIMNSITSI